jgi:hypothetical protein
MLVNTESDLGADNLTVLLQNRQPTRVFDRAKQSQPFVVVPIADPESLTEADVAALAIIAEQPEWLVIMDHANRVRGIIEPQRTKDLRIAARATVKLGEFGGKITPLPGEVEVSVSFYGCPRHPEAGRFALHQIGAPIPHCPICGEPMTKLQEKSKRAKVAPKLKGLARSG